MTSISETIPLWPLLAFVYFFSIYVTWEWKYHHWRYFPGGKGNDLTVVLGLFLTAVLSIILVWLWLSGETGGIWGLISTVVLWIVQLYLILKPRTRGKREA